MKHLKNFIISAVMIITLGAAAFGWQAAASAQGATPTPTLKSAAYLTDTGTDVDLTPKTIAWEVTSNTTLDSTSPTSYSGDVQVDDKDASGNPITLDLNGMTLTVKGSLYIFGKLHVNNGTLIVTGNLVINNGLLIMNEDASKVTVNGKFFTYGRDHTGSLTAGTLEVHGDFIQSNNYSDNAFCPTGTFKTILKGSNKLLYFDSPDGSWIAGYDFSGASFKAGSVYSFNLSLSSDLTMTYANLTIRGLLNGHTLTVPANTVIGGMLSPGGGRLNANGALLVDYNGGITMSNPNDYLYVNGNFTTEGISSLQNGTVEIHGNFTQFGLVSGFHDNAWVSLQANKTKIIGDNRRIHFDSPATSCFGQLDTTAATITSDSTVSMNCDLTADTTFSYPELYYGGHLNGHNLTVTSNLYARQIVLGGGTLTVGSPSASHNFTAAADNCLIMTNTKDKVLVYGDFYSSCSMDPTSITAGMLEVHGNFGQTGGPTSFLASGSNVTKLIGTNKSVKFLAPKTSWFNKLDLSSGVTFTSDSVVSIKNDLDSSLELTLPVLYYSGSLNGYPLTVHGSLHLFGSTNPHGGTITATGAMTLDGTLTMADSNDRLEAYGDFSGSGAAALSAGIAEFKKSFHYTGTAWAASDTNMTVLSGGANMSVIFDQPAKSWFAQVTINPGTTLSSASVLSVKTAGQVDTAYNVPMLYLQGNLNGKKLTQTGSVTVPSGASLTIGGGNLAVTGSMLLDNGLLVMTNAADAVLVSGAFTSKAPDETGKLTQGKLTIKGDFTQDNTNSAKSFVAAITHETILSGTSTQNVNFATPDKVAGSYFGMLYQMNPYIDFHIDDITSCYLDSVFTSATLTSLPCTGGTLVPEFSSDVTNYIYVLPDSTATAAITAVKGFDNSVMTMNGNTVTSVSVPGSEVPANGNTPITIVISSKNSAAITTYTVKVELENENLASLGLSAGTLTPAVFDPDTTTYTVELPASVDSLTVTPITANPDTTFTINGSAVASKKFTLKPGESVPVSIALTGQNGEGTNTYTVIATRDKMLTGINVSTSDLSPVSLSPNKFASTQAAYTVRLTALQDNITIAPVAAAGTTYVIDGITQASATYSVPLGGSRQVAIVASAGATSFTYTVAISRNPIISNFGVSISNTTLSPAFNADGSDFTLTVPASATSLSITPQKSDCTGLTINGTADSFLITQSMLPIGGNTVLTIITHDGALTKTYTLTVVKKAVISNLKLSEGTLSPAFNPTVTSYSVEMPATMDMMTVSPLLLSGSATVNGENWDPELPVWLDPEPGTSDTFTVKCTDGIATVTYTITVHRQKPLSDITLSTGSLSEDFDAETGAYTVSIPASTPSVTITPVLTAQCTAMTINGASGNNVTLSPILGGYLDATISATGPDHTTVTTYTVRVQREALLSSIGLSIGGLAPGFDGITTSYSVYLPSTTTSVTLTPVKTGSCKAMTINGTTVTKITLKPTAGGSAKATIKVTSSNPAVTQTFTVTVYRISPITGIKLSSGTLSPAFSLGKAAYTVSLPASTKAITITPARCDSCATLLIGGIAASSVTLNPDIGCSASTTIVATAVNGQVYTYTVTLNRAAILKGITLSTGTLSPVFSVTTHDYTLTVPVTTASVKVTPAKASSTSGLKTMKINGSSASSITLKPPVGGSAKATITFTTKDGSTVKPYTVTVTRSPMITGISTSNGTLSPVFSTAVTSYTVTLPADTDHTDLAVTKVASDVSDLTMDGSHLSTDTVWPVIGGAKTETIVATAMDGKTKVTYTVTVKRAPVISGITVAGGSLSPAFSATTTNYTVNIPATATQVTLTPIKTADCATLTIDTAPVASKLYNNISPGCNVKTEIIGTTALGKKCTYEITINRAALVTGIKTSTSSYKISPSFSTATTSYVVTIPATKSSITIYATKAKGDKSMTMNGKSVSSLLVSPKAGCSVTVSIVAIGSDNIAKSTYTVTVYRKSLLDGITITGGALTTAFTTAVHSYTINIPATQASVAVTAAGSSYAKTIKINNVTTKTATLTPAVGGSATATIVITGTDGVTKDTYTVTVHRLAPITSIVVSAGSLTPAFSPAVTTYAINLPAATTSTIIAPVMTAGATLTFNGLQGGACIVNKPADSSPVLLAIVATASDGLTKVTYNITVSWS